MNPLWSIVTVNYGNAKDVRRLYKSLKKIKKSSWELIIVDNNSPNNDAKALASIATDPAVKLIKSKKNLGFGGGYRQGVKKATGKLLGIINPDIIIPAGCLEALAKIIENQSQIIIAVPQLVSADNSLQDNVREFPKIWTLIYRRLCGGKNSISPFWRYCKPTPVPWAQGSFLVINRGHFIKKLQQFDQRFFIFFEDVDLCRRTWELGGKVILVPQARAIHGSKRLSGGHWWKIIWKKVFWWHIASAIKYFWKWRQQQIPKIK